MRLLCNFDVFNEYYNIDSYSFCVFNDLQKNIGIYKVIEGTMTGLLVEEKKLYFLYGGGKVLITDSCKVLLKEKGKMEKEFILFNGNNELIRFLYPLPDPELNVFPFEYIAEDDFWGDFVAEIINNKKRQENFVMNKMGNR